MLRDIDRTKRAMRSSLDGLVDCLGDRWLPTLDMNLMVDEENYIHYKFFKKPTDLQSYLQGDTALSKNGIVQALVEDTKRRMFNTCSKVDTDTRNKKKLKNVNDWSAFMISARQTETKM